MKRPLLEQGELPRVVLGFAAFFLLLCSYYILRPVRDEMGVQTGASRLQWLFTATFIATLLVVPVFGWVVRQLPRRLLVPVIYGFFVANLLVFYGIFLAGITRVTAATFFIWLSVFNLFVVSLFWSNVSDVFNTGQAKRVYGYIAAGGSAGALTGPAMTAVLAQHLSTSMLLALSAVLLSGAAGCTMAMRRGIAGAAPDARPIGGSILAGVRLAWQVISLRGIALLIILYTSVSTVLYIEQAAAAGRTFSDSGERTAFFATIDLTTNCLALLTQIVITRRVIQNFGLRVTLSIVPLLVTGGLLFAGAWRTSFILAIVQIVHRAGDFSLMRPGRETIYTTVDQESRYKAKNFIDTTVYRANDAFASWLVAAIRAAGISSFFLFGVPAAVLWFFTGYKVGRRHDRHEPA